MARIKKKFKNGDYFVFDDKRKCSLTIVGLDSGTMLAKRRALALYHFLDRIFGDENKSRR